MNPKYLFFIVNFVVSMHGIMGDRCRNEPSCKVQKVHGMKSADCYKLDLKHIPKCLTEDAEIIDLSYNRIREIKADDLRKFKYLKFLYLAENMITNIESESLADKTNLQALDLSYNAFSQTLPEVIFHLPSLKNLYLSQNQNINIIDIIHAATPITSPLVLLDISHNKYSDIQTLPNLGIVPTLLVYNVSGMDFTMTFADVAGLCNLHSFVLDNSTVYFEDPCDCWTMGKWLKDRNVNFIPFDCKRSVEDECSFEIPQMAEEVFSACKQQHAEQIFQEKLNTTLIVVGSILCIVFLSLLIIIYRIRKNRIRRREIKRRNFI